MYFDVIRSDFKTNIVTEFDCGLILSSTNRARNFVSDLFSVKCKLKRIKIFFVEMTY